MTKKILLVEDNDDSRAFLKFALELDGYEVSEAINGQQSISMAENSQFDLVLMDIAMSDINGLTAIKKIR